MTPAERASQVVQTWNAKQNWAYDPVQHMEFEGLIAGAIRHAVAAEREACAKAAERVAASFGKDKSYPEVVAAATVAKAIREGK